MTAADLAARLAGGAKRRGEWYDGRCPAHDDAHASLSFRDGARGLVVLCRAGCTREQIARALGVADLFGGNSSRRAPRVGKGGTVIPPKAAATVQPPVGCTLAQYAEAKRLPPDFLRGLGLRDMSYLGAPAVRIPYLDETGAEVAVRIRTALAKSEAGASRFVWRRGSKPILYGLWRVGAAPQADFMVLVEGESDCHTLWAQKIPALGLPGAAHWRETWAGNLDGIPLLYVVIEPDRGGQAVR
ncbi:MAG: hypothetical protein HY002_03625, partial [Candidatus Rokubacteria bacterium]|nr:hypothetical protein [Candidatus Rokubacteria bacterium]